MSITVSIERPERIVGIDAAGEAKRAVSVGRNLRYQPKGWYDFDWSNFFIADLPDGFPDLPAAIAWLRSQGAVKFLVTGRGEMVPTDNPEMDCTDFAHPAWWRGSESGVARIVQKLQWILDGNEIGDGKTAHPPLNKLIGDIVAIRKAVGLLRDFNGHEDMDNAEVIEAAAKEIVSLREAFRMVGSTALNSTKEAKDLRSELAQAKAETSTERKLRIEDQDAMARFNQAEIDRFAASESDLPAALHDGGKDCPCPLCVHWRKCDTAIAARDTDALIGLVREMNDDAADMGEDLDRLSAIMDGSWHNAVPILERALARAKAVKHD